MLKRRLSFMTLSSQVIDSISTDPINCLFIYIFNTFSYEVSVVTIAADRSLEAPQKAFGQLVGSPFLLRTNSAFF